MVAQWSDWIRVTQVRIPVEIALQCWMKRKSGLDIAKSLFYHLCVGGFLLL